MANSVYKINKGINQPIEFKGLKAQFIWYLGGGLVGLLILFAVMYFLQFNTYVSLAVIAIAATALFMRVYKLSNTYGEHGMTDNILHMVLARLPDAPPGSAGISLFAVPKLRADGTRNGVRCEAIEEHLQLECGRRGRR